jgi:MioC protein
MKIEIAVGSVLGASEYVAEALADMLKTQGFESTCHFTPSVDNIDFAQFLLIVTSTHGAGDLPDNIQSFAEDLSKKDLKGTKAVIIGLGDSSYDTFCEGSATMETILKDSGATMVLPVYQIDVLHHPIPEDAAVAWLEKNISALKA